MRNQPPVSAAALFGKPAQVIFGHAHLALALRQRLAVFQRDDAGDFVCALVHFVGDAQQQSAALLGCEAAPRGVRRLCGYERIAHLVAIDRGHAGERLAGRGVLYMDLFTGFDPLPPRYTLCTFS